MFVETICLSLCFCFFFMSNEKLVDWTEFWTFQKISIGLIGTFFCLSQDFHRKPQHISACSKDVIIFFCLLYVIHQNHKYGVHKLSIKERESGEKGAAAYNETPSHMCNMEVRYSFIIHRWKYTCNSLKYVRTICDQKKKRFMHHELLTPVNCQSWN